MGSRQGLNFVRKKSSPTCFPPWSLSVVSGPGCLPLLASREMVVENFPAVLCLGGLCSGGSGKIARSVCVSYPASPQDNLRSCWEGEYVPCLETGWNMSQFPSVGNSVIFNHAMCSSVQLCFMLPEHCLISIVCKVVACCEVCCRGIPMQRRWRTTLTIQDHCVQNVWRCCRLASLVRSRISQPQIAQERDAYP